MANDPWSEWKASDEGKQCRDYSTLAGADYLENRLWWAFNAGLRAAEKSSPIANSERGSDNGPEQR